MDLNPKEQPELWRSLEDYLDTPEFREQMAREFPDDADKWTDPVTRRHFVKLMGASMALAGLAGCSPRPASPRTIVPYVRQPERIIPGLPLFFATASTINGVASGLLIKSREGRPIKAEGNPDHPSSLGATDVFSQASILDLYDPERSKAVLHLGAASTWDNAIAALRSELAARGDGSGVRVLTETITSPTLIGLMESFLEAYPEAEWVQYDPAGSHSARAGASRAFDKPVAVTYDFSKASVVLSLDCDFLSATGPGAVRYTRDFMKARKKVSAHRHGDHFHVDEAEMNRLYVVESMMSCTGASADHRLPLKPSEVESFARMLARELGVEIAGEPGPIGGAVAELARQWVKPLADDLKQAGKSAVVVPGDCQSPAVHALAHAMNLALENTGETVIYTEPVEASPGDQVAGLTSLVEEMNAGSVECLLVFGGNPVYNAPADLKFAEALRRVPLVFRYGAHRDETSMGAHWLLPSTHFLEAWGDARGHDGTVTIQQPLIAPLYSGMSMLEFFATILGRDESSDRAVLRAYWREFWKAQESDDRFETWWEKAVQTGVVPGTRRASETPELKDDWDFESEAPAAGEFEIAFRVDPTVYDGRFANNGWLQELPKPITHITWGNAACISKRTADKLGVTNRPAWTAGERGRVHSDVITIKMGDRQVTAPAWIVPGVADDTVVLSLGYGRTHAGDTGNGHGTNAYLLRTSDALWHGTIETPSKTGDSEIVACVQMHHEMVHDGIDRRPVRRSTLSEFKKHPDFARYGSAAANEVDLYESLLPENQGRDAHGGDDDHHHGDDEHHHDHHHDERLVPLSMYPDTSSKVYRRWAMAIDTTSCTGCGACVIACQAENNIPIVGRHEVTRGREMHWIRVDSYHSGDPAEGENLETHFQPVPCQQCEKAPCEVVCPVAATVHSADGLNDMVYNRCVGTRYCSNNCPYKVRRFNFLTYADYATESLKLGNNPEVTVRTRGVMEKCTYCVQRIRAAEIVAEREFRPIADGEIVTACESACPAGAIVFGDLSDPKSVVNTWKKQPLNYGLLAELNTMPRTTYLASLRNPNPAMPEQHAKKGGKH